jgi:hypothetical protein
MERKVPIVLSFIETDVLDPFQPKRRHFIYARYYCGEQNLLSPQRFQAVRHRQRNGRRIEESC